MVQMAVRAVRPPVAHDLVAHDLVAHDLVARDPVADRADRCLAIEGLLAAEGAKLLAFARRTCGDGSDAEDIVQEAFAQAFRAWHQLTDPSQARAWLYAIARRVCQRMHRLRAGQPARLESLDELQPRPTATLPDLGDGACDPHGACLRAEARELVEQAISCLPEPFRRTLVLADVAELATDEIAAVLGVKEATVKTRLHRARLKLRVVLAEGLPQRPAPAGPSASHARKVCLDLLRSKLDAMDHHVPFPYSDAALCERCRTLLGTLDLAAVACRSLADEQLSLALRARLEWASQ